MWRTSTPDAQQISEERLAQLMEAIESSHPEVEGVTIARNGYLVFDNYCAPLDGTRLQRIYSCSKSVLSALIGIALDRGLLTSVHLPVRHYLGHRRLGRITGQITIEQLLTMTSGLDLNDQASDMQSSKNYAALKMSADWTQHVLDRPVRATSAGKFTYCNGGSHLLSSILEACIGCSANDFAIEHLFAPLGINHSRWERSPEGTNIGWTGISMSAHDMAKFGWMYLQGGRWHDDQVISERWVRESTRAHVEATPFSHYGYHWWVEPNYVMAVGHGGQAILIAPSLQLIAVFTSSAARGRLITPKVLFDRYILPAVDAPARRDTQYARRIPIRTRRLPRWTWKSETEGCACNGVFTRTAAPAFRFEYPADSQRNEITSQDQIMSMQTAEKDYFGAGVAALPPGATLAATPAMYAARLASVPGIENVQIESQLSIALRSCTPALLAILRWTWQTSIPMRTRALCVLRDDHWIYVDAHTSTHFHDMESIFASLELLPTQPSTNTREAIAVS